MSAQMDFQLHVAKDHLSKGQSIPTDKKKRLTCPECKSLQARWHDEAEEQKR